MTGVVLDDLAFRIELDPRGLCRIARTNVGFDTTDAAIRAHERVVDAVATLRGATVAIFDLRLAPPRNDPEFERVVLSLNQRMFKPFLRVAFIVRTAAGKLHVRRLTKIAAEYEVFVEEPDAIAWLLRN